MVLHKIFEPLLTRLTLCLAAIILLVPVQVAAQDVVDDSGPVNPDPVGTTYSTGLVSPSPEQFRGFKHLPPFRAFLPEHVDLSRFFPTPGNQGQLGSCTAWATGYAARAYYAVRVDGRARNDPKNIPSPEYIYNSIKTSQDCSGGSSISDALKLLEKGVVSIAAYPHAAQTCATIEQSLAEKATGFRIQDSNAVNYANPDDIKGELAKGNPVIVGMFAGQKFQDLRGADVFSNNERQSDGSHAMTNTGYHAITITGYDDRKQAFRLINSWGRGWGDKGYAWISYQTLSQLADEAYAMKVERAVPPEPNPGPNILDAACAFVREKIDSGHLIVSGFVGSDAEADSIRKTYVGKNAEFKLDFRPWPQCEILKTLGVQVDAKDKPTLETSAISGNLASGANLSIAITSPNWPAYIYANYVQADGSVVTLSQPQFSPPQPLDRNTKRIFGDGKDGRSKFTVGAPYGNEIIVVLASRSPLFDEALPEAMTERDYLSRVRKALIYKPDLSQPDREISAAVQPILTQEK